MKQKDTIMTNQHRQDKRFRSVEGSRTFGNILSEYRLRERRVLDIGCGYGQYLVHFGEASAGITTTPDQVAYGKERGIDIVYGNAEEVDTLKFGRTFEAIWANNLFEHLLSPHAFLMKLKAVAESEAVLVLGVPVVPRVASLMRVKKFRGALASNHINFFTRETLRLTVASAGWQVMDIRPFYTSVRAVDRFFGVIAPHLYVVAKNDASFRYPPKKYQEWEAEPYYAHMLNITGQK